MKNDQIYLVVRTSDRLKTQLKIELVGERRPSFFSN